MLTDERADAKETIAIDTSPTLGAASHLENVDPGVWSESFSPRESTKATEAIANGTSEALPTMQVIGLLYYSIMRDWELGLLCLAAWVELNRSLFRTKARQLT
ncbi:unnamed protein product [Protopolystoma xenopodis]|uniref:Uncharacterized protein n=1 Tax=Protopolystoma xenopodis TaxID=117903 RepID=A0A3S5AJ94_9PLAT|nr:unnamed protein product [Protopolystoma xenopodis]